jgi:hypothetical protein
VINPQAFQINNDGYGQAVYAVSEMGPGVVLGQSVSEYGQSAHLVDYPARAAVPVHFVDGPPPGSAEYMARQAIENQQHCAAWASAQQAAAVQMQIVEQLLQQS